MITVQQVRELLNSISILEGDGAYLITSDNKKMYDGTEFCIVVYDNGNISPKLRIGSYAAHSGSEVIKLQGELLHSAIEKIIEECDLIVLSEKVVQLKKNAKKT
jgi:hypothetical protein